MDECSIVPILSIVVFYGNPKMKEEKQKGDRFYDSQQTKHWPQPLARLSLLTVIPWSSNIEKYSESDMAPFLSLST